MDTLLNPYDGDYVLNAQTSSLHNAAYLRIKTQLGSYWADKTLGSKLHLLARSKDAISVQTLAKQYAEQALQPLLDDKRASTIEVSAERPRKGWLVLVVDIWDAGGSHVNFKHPVKVI